MNHSEQTQLNSKNVKIQHPIKVLYTNWRGETAVRSIMPLKIYFGSTEYYPKEQWLLEVFDLDRNAIRVYALQEIKQWFV